MVYDFATDKVSLPLEKAMNDNNVRTSFEGLFTQLPGGATLIEDVTEARFMIFRQDGSIAAEYVNRAKDGHSIISAGAATSTRQRGTSCCGI